MNRYSYDRRTTRFASARITEHEGPEGLISVTVSGSLDEGEDTSFLSFVRTLMSRLKKLISGARSGEEYPVDLKLDLTGVTSISEDAVQAVRRVALIIAEYGPLISTMTISARTGTPSVAGKLGILGRLTSNQLKSKGVELVVHRALPGQDKVDENSPFKKLFEEVRG